MIPRAVLHIKNFNTLYLSSEEYSLLGLDPRKELPKDIDLNIGLVRKLIHEKNETIKSLIHEIRSTNAAIELEVASAIISIEDTLEKKVGRIPFILHHIAEGEKLTLGNKSIRSEMLKIKKPEEYQYFIVFPDLLATAQENLCKLNQNLRRICEPNLLKNTVYENLDEVYDNLQDIHLLINAYCEYYYEFYTHLSDDFKSIKDPYFKTNSYALLKQKNQVSEQERKETGAIVNVDQKEKRLKKPSIVLPYSIVDEIRFYPYKDTIENVYNGNSDLALVEDSELEKELRELKIVTTKIDIIENKPNPKPNNEIFLKFLNDLVADLMLNAKKRNSERSLFTYGIKNITLANHRNALVTQLLIVLKKTLEELSPKPDASSITFVDQDALLTLISDAHAINSRMTAQFARFFDSKGSLNTLLETKLNTLSNLKF